MDRDQKPSNSECLGLHDQSASQAKPRHLAGYLFGLLFDPEDGGSTFLQNTNELLPDFTVSYPRTQYFL
jgi:hypothetical protein